MPTDARLRSWVEIDPTALAQNARTARDMAGGGAEVMAVVKADGYGHGLEEVARALLGEVEAFGVATLDEALAVRRIAGSEKAVMMLGGLLPDEREPALREGISVTMSSVPEAEAYSSLAVTTGTEARVHLVVDTGMGRIGLLEEGAPEAARAIASLPGLRVEGMATHFPSADEDREFTAGQIRRFTGICEATGLSTRWVHLSNSAGVIGFGAAGGNLVRPGLMLYGVDPFRELADGIEPALSWRTRVTQVRDLPAGSGISYGRRFVTAAPTRVATLSVGYGDGYPRALSGSGAETLVAGRRCPLLGRVTMDQIMVDVGAVDPPPLPGAVATLLGHEGGEEITAWELADKAGTIPWEILTGIAARVARVPVPGDSR